MAPRAPMDIAGTTGLSRWAGRIDEERVLQLRGRRWRDVLREMLDNHPVIGAVRFTMESLARQVDWSILPARVDRADPDYAGRLAEAEEVAEFCRAGLFEDMEQSWPATLASILSFLWWGHAVPEVLWKLRQGPGDDPRTASKFDDGRVGIRSISPRAQDSIDEWDFADDGRVKGYWQIAPPSWERLYVPISKCLHFTTASDKASPEGRSLFRNAWRAWHFQKQMEEIEAIGIERDLAGLPVAWVPSALLKADKTADEQAAYNYFVKLVTTIHRGEQEGLLMPLAHDASGNRQYDLTLLSTGGQRQFNIDATIARYDQRIAMTCAADFILLGHEKVGSFALSSSKTNLFSLAMGAFLDEVTAEINNKLLPALVAYNGWDQAVTPALHHGDIESADLEVLGAYVKALADVGMPLFPNEELQRFLLGVAGLPVPDEIGDAEEAESDEEPGEGPDSETDPDTEPTDDEDATLRRDVDVLGQIADQLAAAEDGRYEAATVMAELPEDLSARIVALARETIRPEDLSTDGDAKGIEENPHITVLYGIGDDRRLADVTRALAGADTVPIRLGATGMFAAAASGKPYDVVYLSVQAPGLHKLREAIVSHLLPYREPAKGELRTYHPHVTLAYVKAGRGAKYAAQHGPFEDESITLRELVYSDRTGEQTPLPLSEREA